jgi:hypothetical protein
MRCTSMMCMSMRCTAYEMYVCEMHAFEKDTLMIAREMHTSVRYTRL